MSTSIVWDEPPARRRGGGINLYVEFAAALRANPKRWARFPGPSRSTATAAQIKAGRYAAFSPAGHFEATTRRIDGELRTWVRYVGGVSL